jgi:hypothetical protein
VGLPGWGGVLGAAGVVVGVAGVVLGAAGVVLGVAGVVLGVGVVVLAVAALDVPNEMDAPAAGAEGLGVTRQVAACATGPAVSVVAQPEARCAVEVAEPRDGDDARRAGFDARRAGFDARETTTCRCEVECSAAWCDAGAVAGGATGAVAGAAVVADVDVAAVVVVTLAPLGGAGVAVGVVTCEASANAGTEVAVTATDVATAAICRGLMVRGRAGGRSRSDRMGLNESWRTGAGRVTATGWRSPASRVNRAGVASTTPSGTENVADHSTSNPAGPPLRRRRSMAHVSAVTEIGAPGPSGSITTCAPDGAAGSPARRASSRSTAQSFHSPLTGE